MRAAEAGAVKKTRMASRRQPTTLPLPWALPATPWARRSSDDETPHLFGSDAGHRRRLPRRSQHDRYPCARAHGFYRTFSRRLANAEPLTTDPVIFTVRFQCAPTFV